MTKEIQNLPGDYIAGFVDGEGCFSLKFRKDKKKNKLDGKVREYFYWAVEFAIVLRADDSDILNLIRSTLSCGHVTFSSHQARFSVQNSKELAEIIIPYFRKHQLRAKKRGDFELWSEAVKILDNNKDGILNIKEGQKGFIKKDLNKDDAYVLQKIRHQMSKYKSKRSRDFRWGR